MQRNGVDKILFLIAVAWIWFVMTGLRMPWQPIVRGEEGGSGGGAIRQAFFLGCSGWAIYRMMAMGAYNQIVGHFLPAAFLAVMLVASVLWSNDTTLTIKRSIIHVLGFHVLIAIIANSRWPLNAMMKTTVYTVGISAFISFGAMIALPANCTSNPIRPGLAGVTIHPNNYGPCLYMAILLSFGVITFSRREKIFLRACQVMMLVCMMLTNSMTATVAMFAAIGFYVMLTVSSYRAGMLQVAAVASLLLIQLIGVDNLKTAFFEASGRDENLSGRDVLWAAVYNEGLKKPIFGSGYGSFWYEGRGLEITGTWNPRQSHNAYLDIFVDLGIVGLLFWMWFTHSRMGLAWLHWAGERGTRRRNAISANLAMALTPVLGRRVRRELLPEVRQVPVLRLLLDGLDLPQPRRELALQRVR